MRLSVASAAIVWLWGGVASGQLSHLSVTDDGSQASFLVSTLRPVGSSQQISPGTAYTLASVGLQPVATSFPDPQVSLSSLTMSGDGSAIAFNGKRACPPGAPFTFPPYPANFEQFQTVIRWPGGTATFPGVTGFSSTGRFAVVYGQSGSNPRSVVVIDLTSGAQFTTGDLAATAGRFLTADGSVAVAKAGNLVLAANGSDRSFGAWDQLADSLWVDDAGRTIVYEIGHRVHVRDTAGIDQIVGPEGIDSSGPSLSRDGQTIAFRSSDGRVQQVFVANRDGSARQVTFEPEGVREAVLAGDGSLVFVLTNTGRLLKVLVATETVEQLLGPAFVVWTDGPWTTPGALVRLLGSFPTGSPRISINGVPAPVVSVRAESIEFQTPWEISSQSPSTLTQGPLATLIVRFDGSPWEAVAGSFLFNFAPYIPQANIVHQDFGSLVDFQHPARPGEVVHLFGTGFGAVDPPVPTGVATPLEPLARITAPCVWVDALRNDQPLEVLFAGLAPGLVGQNQIDVRIPENPEGPPAVWFSCKNPVNTLQIVTIPARLVD